MHGPKYSLLLPVRNEVGRVDEVVRSLFTDLGSNPDWEVCIGDDFSQDGTRQRLEYLTSIFPFRLLAPPENLGRGALRNLLAAEARGQMLVFLDGDCRTMPGFFRAWEGADADAAHLGKVTYETTPPSGFNRFLTRGSGIGKLKDQGSIPAAYFISQNFAISKALFQAVGGFRTDLLGWGGEDVDLGCKLRRHPVSLRYREAAEARHPSVTGLEGYFARLTHFGRLNLPLLVRDHPALERQFKLGWARPPWSHLFLNPLAYHICRFLVTRLRGWPWPYPLYRCVIFNCYARAYRQAARTSR
jgi:glycosyltransferase involved in cell wall biosynthesis